MHRAVGVARNDGDPLQAAAALAARVLRRDRSLPLPEIETMEEVVPAVESVLVAAVDVAVDRGYASRR